MVNDEQTILHSMNPSPNLSFSFCLNHRGTIRLLGLAAEGSFATSFFVFAVRLATDNYTPYINHLKVYSEKMIYFNSSFQDHCTLLKE